jgi:hypothetical protein
MITHMLLFRVPLCRCTACPPWTEAKCRSSRTTPASTSPTSVPPPSPWRTSARLVRQCSPQLSRGVWRGRFLRLHGDAVSLYVVEWVNSHLQREVGCVCTVNCATSTSFHTYCMLGVYLRQCMHSLTGSVPVPVFVVSLYRDQRRAAGDAVQRDQLPAVQPHEAHQHYGARHGHRAGERDSEHDRPRAAAARARVIDTPGGVVECVHYKAV